MSMPEVSIEGEKWFAVIAKILSIATLKCWNISQTVYFTVMSENSVYVLVGAESMQMACFHPKLDQITSNKL